MCCFEGTAYFFDSTTLCFANFTIIDFWSIILILNEDPSLSPYIGESTVTHNKSCTVNSIKGV